MASMPDELEAVLRLVAAGRITPEEAAPIVDALSRLPGAQAAPEHEHGPDADPDADPDDPWDIDGRLHRRLERRMNRVHRRVERAHARAEAVAERFGADGRPMRHLRIKVTERGRQVVNLRIPIGFVDTALRFVPGLGGEQSTRIRDAVRAGAVGPILDVEDPDGQGGVLISVE